MWIYIPEENNLMNSASLPAQAEESLEQNTSADSKQFVMSKSINIVKMSSRHESKTESLMMPQSGMMSGHLTETLGVESWMSLLRVSRVNRFQSQANRKPTWTKEIAGKIPFALLEKSSLNGAYWKTSQGCLPALTDISDKYSRTWTKAGILQGGECYRLPELEHRISGRDCGLLPTPKSTIWGDCPSERKRKSPDICAFVKMYPTPTVQDSKNNANASQYSRNFLSLNTVVGGSLNPNWVEWLMGYPIGLTDLKPLAMDRFQQWLEKFGIYYPNNEEAA